METTGCAKSGLLSQRFPPSLKPSPILDATIPLLPEPFSSPVAANPMFLKSNNYQANSYQRRSGCPDEPRPRKTGTAFPFPHHHRPSNQTNSRGGNGLAVPAFCPVRKAQTLAPRPPFRPSQPAFIPRCREPAVGRSHHSKIIPNPTPSTTYTPFPQPRKFVFPTRHVSF